MSLREKKPIYATLSRKSGRMKILQIASEEFGLIAQTASAQFEEPTQNEDNVKKGQTASDFFASTDTSILQTLPEESWSSHAELERKRRVLDSNTESKPGQGDQP